MCIRDRWNRRRFPSLKHMGFGNPMGGNYAIHQVIFSRQPLRAGTSISPRPPGSFTVAGGSHSPGKSPVHTDDPSASDSLAAETERTNSKMSGGALEGAPASKGG